MAHLWPIFRLARAGWCTLEAAKTVLHITDIVKSNWALDATLDAEAEAEEQARARAEEAAKQKR